MEKNKVIFLLLGVFLLSFVSAEDIYPFHVGFDDVVVYYNFDNTTGDLKDVFGNYDLTEFGSVSEQVGLINNSRGLYSTTNYFITNSFISNDHTTSFTDNIWIYRTGEAGLESRFIDRTGGANDLLYNIQLEGDKTIKVIMGKSGVGTSVEIDSSYVIPLNTWTMITTTYSNSTNITTLYINAINNGTDIMTDAPNPVTFLGVGINNGTNRPMDKGFLDEYSYFQKDLNQTQITDLYNLSFGLLLLLDYPKITVNLPPSSISIGTININATITANQTLDTCYYNITKGASTEKSNTFINCSNFTDIYSLSSEGIYSLNVWANSTLNGASNSTFKFFTYSTFISGGGGGGTITTITDDGDVLIDVCEQFRIPLDVAWESFLEDSNIDNLKILWTAFWNRSLCDSAGSIVPI